MSKAMEIGDGNFQAAAGAGKPLLLDFTAAWCPPCRAQGLVIDAMAAEYEGKVSFGKVDVDSNPGLVARFKVMSMPTLMLLKDGQVVQAAVGYRGKAELARMLEGI